MQTIQKWETLFKKRRDNHADIDNLRSSYLAGLLKIACVKSQNIHCKKKRQHCETILAKCDSRLSTLLQLILRHTLYKAREDPLLYKAKAKTPA